MRIYRNRRIVTLLLFGFLLLGLTMYVQSAAADEDPQWESNWYITVDFVGNTPNAELVVQVWEYIDGIPQPLPPAVEQLDCSAAPSVNLVNDTAVFSGKGAIRCAMPSIQKIVWELTDGEFELDDACDCKTGATATATVQYVPNTTLSTFDNPLFSLVGLDWSTPMQANSFRPGLQMIVDSATAESKDFAATYSPMSLTTDFMPLGNDKFMPFFTAVGIPLTSVPALIQQPLAISNNQTVLYIGYSPHTKESLNGTLIDLFLDPGCFGNGT